MLNSLLNKITCADSIEVLKQLPDKCIDLCLSDPPYGVGVEYKSFEDTQENLKVLIDGIMPEILRVSKRVVLTCGIYSIQLYPKPTWIMAWVCNAGTGRNPWGFTCWNPILVYGKDPYLECGKGSYPDIILDNSISEKETGHPCPKPLDVWLKLLIRSSCKETDIVLDPFSGSGTTALACKRLNRRFICIDKEHEYVDKANQRLNDVQPIISMFDILKK